MVLNLFSLMLDSGIPDIAVEKEKAVQKVEQRYVFLSVYSADNYKNECAFSTKVLILSVHCQMSWFIIENFNYIVLYYVDFYGILPTPARSFFAEDPVFFYFFDKYIIRVKFTS